MESNSVTPFLSKTYDMVDNPSTNSVVSWSNSDNSFVVWNVPEFQKELLPKYFKHNNFSSFVRQLNTYGFRKVDPDRFEFANEGFLRGQKHLLKSISRKKHLHAQNNQPPQVKVASCVEVGKFGLEEEVERLKRDKNVLMQELVRLRQQQQATDNQLQTVGQRVQTMEQRQQQMMSFLAKAMHSPGFLNQLVQQKNDGNRHIAGSSRKRRLPRQEEENLGHPLCDNSPNGQIVKFHSSMNEAAKAMLHQILKMNPSYRLESINSGSFLINNLPSSGLDSSSSSSSRISELMFSEVLSASGPSFIPVESGFSANHLSNVISEVQSPSVAVPDNVGTDHLAEMKADNIASGASLPQLPGRQEFMPESSITTPNLNFVASQTENAGNMNLMSSVLDAEIPLEAESFSPDGNRDMLVDGISKLPGITDSFWEQFLTASPLTVGTDEFNSSSPESCMSREQELQSRQENGWENIQTMNHLSEQMELLTSERGV